MPRDPREPLDERPCRTCQQPFRPVLGRNGGRPPVRCERCRTSVRQFPTTLSTATPALEDDLDQLSAQARSRSHVPDAARGRILDVIHLLEAERDTRDSETLAACARALRELCGYTSRRQDDTQQVS